MFGLVENHIPWLGNLDLPMTLASKVKLVIGGKYIYVTQLTS